MRVGEMRNVVHSAIRESIHSVSYVCINRLLNFVNQNKIVETTRGATWTDLCCRCSRPQQRRLTKLGGQIDATPSQSRGIAS
jgi:hypothetical protein